MNYSSDLLENKDFDIVKRGMYYLAVAMCVILTIALIMFKFMGFYGYVVLTGSMEPVYKVQDIVVVKQYEDYKVGDVLKFTALETEDFPTTHRCLGIETIAGTKYYICLGDNNYTRVGSYDKDQFKADNHGRDWTYQDDIDYIKSLNLSSYSSYSDAVSQSQLYSGVQIIEYKDITGKVIGSIPQGGQVTGFVSAHPLLLITIVIAVWCVTESYNSEQEIKKAKRLFK